MTPVPYTEVGRVANPPVLYNVGTGKGVSVREFVECCKRVTAGRALLGA